MANSEKGGKSEQLMRLWTATLVVATLFLVLFGIQTVFLQEESSIRRESYLTNLEQFYQQDLQECLTLTAQVAQVAQVAEGEEPAPDQSQQCLERVNEESRFAKLIKKHGGDELIRTDLNQN